MAVCYGSPRKLTPSQICLSPTLQMMAALILQLTPKTLLWGRGSHPWPFSSHLIHQQTLFCYLQNIPWSQLFLIFSIATVIISCLPYYKNLLTHLPAMICSIWGKCLLFSFVHSLFAYSGISAQVVSFLMKPNGWKYKRHRQWVIKQVSPLMPGAWRGKM